MKRALVAAALSVALHALAVLLWVEDAPPSVPVAAPREKPVQIEVMRLKELISAPPRHMVPAATPHAVSHAAVNVKAAPVTVAAVPGEKAEPVAQRSGAAAAPQAQTGDVKSETGAPIDTTALSRRLQAVALRCYPAAARRFHQTGEAQIEFCLDGAGALRETTVIQSTGSGLLDHAATDCVVPGAAPFGAETFGRCFTVPVRFNP